jgi:hypothetical protein
MAFDWINESNALVAAQCLLSLDISCIESLYQEDVADWIMSVKQAREQHLHHALFNAYNSSDKLSSSESLSKLDLEKYSLDVLLLRIHAFLPLLTPYGTECLQAQLTNKTQQKQSKQFHETIKKCKSV